MGTTVGVRFPYRLNNFIKFADKATLKKSSKHLSTTKSNRGVNAPTGEKGTRTCPTANGDAPEGVHRDGHDRRGSIPVPTKPYPNT